MKEPPTEEQLATSLTSTPQVAANTPQTVTRSASATFAEPTRSTGVAPTSILASAPAPTHASASVAAPASAYIPTPVPAPSVIGEAPYQNSDSRGAGFYIGILWNIFVGLFCIGGCIYYIRQIFAGAGDVAFGTYSLSSILLLGLGFLVSDKRLLREKFPDTIGKVKNWHILIALVLLVLFAAIIFVFAAMFTGR